MAKLTLYRKLLFNIGIPYWIFINGSPIGLMRSKSVCINIPEGNYNIGIQIVFQIWKWQLRIGGEKHISLIANGEKKLMINDRERWWNIVFDIDLVVWIASFFFTLPSPWNIVYHVLSEGFFAVWLIRIIAIRKRYFVLEEIDVA